MLKRHSVHGQQVNMHREPVIIEIQSHHGSCNTASSIPLLRNLSSLMLLVLLRTLLLLRLGRGMQIRNNTLRRHPAGRLPGLDVQDVHGVHFLQGTALGLVDEEEGDQHGGEAAAGEDVAVVEVDGAGDEGGEERDKEVPGPVGGSGNPHAGSAVAVWVHF